MSYSREIEDFGITTLPVDPNIFPPEVVSIAQEIDSMIGKWDEVRYRAQDKTCEEVIKSAEIADAGVMKEKILAGQTDAFDEMPNVEKAKVENQAAKLRFHAFQQALNQKFRELREAMIANTETIRANCAAEFEEAAQDLEKVIQKSQADFQKKTERFASIAAAPVFVANLVSHASSGLTIPWTPIQGTDYSPALNAIKNARKVAEVAFQEELPVYLGTQTGENGTTCEVDLVRTTPPARDDGALYWPITLRDGTVITTRDEVEQIRQKLRRLGYTIAAR